MGAAGGRPVAAAIHPARPATVGCSKIVRRSTSTPNTAPAREGRAGTGPPPDPGAGAGGEPAPRRRVPAEVEETVVPAQPALELQDLAEEIGQDLLARSPRVVERLAAGRLRLRRCDPLQGA